jgi:penicillin-binding protein 1C
MKPFTYLLAFERGATPASIVADLPVEFGTASGTYRPENFSLRSYGPMTYRYALGNSLNISAVRVLDSIGGAETLLPKLRELGLSTLNEDAAYYGLGLTIGNAEVRLLELTNVYATLARMGEWRPVRLVANREHKDPPAKMPRVAPELCWLIADMLSDNAAREPAFGAISSLRFPFPVACKTGTSTDFRDNWAMAYTPEFTVGVWVGNFNGAPMREVSGVTGAAPIMNDVMSYLHRRFGTTWFERPAKIVEQVVHPLTGKKLVSAGDHGVMEKFFEEQVPMVETVKDYDSKGRVILSPEYAEWAKSVDNQLGDKVAIAEDGGLHLVSPIQGATFVVDPDVPSSSLVPLVANGGERLIWESATLKVREQAGQ